MDRLPSVSREQSADNEAGWWLRQLKIPLEYATEFYHRYPYEGNDSHPPREVRIKALESAYYSFPSTTETLSGMPVGFTDDNFERLFIRPTLLLKMGIETRKLTPAEIKESEEYKRKNQ